MRDEVEHLVKIPVNACSGARQLQHDVDVVDGWTCTLHEEFVT
jgi:hypothetical protein